MMYSLDISADGEAGTIALLQGASQVVTGVFSLDRHTGRNALEALAQLVRANGVEWSQIALIRLKTGEMGSSGARALAVTAETLGLVTGASVEVVENST